MGRRKLIFNYSDKEIDSELSKYPETAIEIYEGSIRDKTKCDLNLIKDIINDDSEMTSIWYRLVALKLYRELGGK